MAMSSTRSWFELPFDLKSNILARIGVFDILENAQRVCTDWYKACKNPAMWRVIDMNKNKLPFLVASHKLKEMCKQAVDRSQGQLVDITISDFGDDELLQYVADRSSQLRRLKLLCCRGDTYGRLNEALKKFPLLEELGLYATEIPKDVIEIAGSYCRMLKTLVLNQELGGLSYGILAVNNEIAIAIGENLHELRHLVLIGNGVSNIGLRVILDGCGQLESLDLRGCMNLDLKGDLMKRCLERIKYLKVTNDGLDGQRRGVGIENRVYLHDYDDESYGYSDDDDLVDDGYDNVTNDDDEEEEEDDVFTDGDDDDVTEDDDGGGGGADDVSDDDGGGNGDFTDVDDGCDDDDDDDDDGGGGDDDDDDDDDDGGGDDCGDYDDDGDDCGDYDDDDDDFTYY